MHLPVSVFLERLSLALKEVSSDIDHAQQALHRSMERGQFSSEDIEHLQKIDIASQESTQLSLLVERAKAFDDMIDLTDSLEVIKLDAIKHILLTGSPIENDEGHKESFSGDAELF